MIISLFGTLICYALSFLLLTSVLDYTIALDPITIMKVLCLSTISWLPFFLYSKFKKCCFPEAHEKLNLIEA